ncbi:MAG: hypothetical protein H7A04_05615 [Pseudomonadales bacterium]|nr:hypothetical protein [Pseudomonadales bacterium]
MARHYSPSNFFRQVPNALLARFFSDRGLFNDLDFAAMLETKPDVLNDSWLKLPEELRKPLDAEFQDIFELSCEKGFRAIIDEAQWQLQADPDGLTAFIETLSELPNHYHRAMLTYLDHGECWKGATRFYHADTLPFWRKRKNMGHQSAAVDDSSIQQLASKISNYFHRTEGRGNNCVVEPFRRGELDYYFAYPEDYSQQSIEWVDGEFGRRPHNPAFEVIFVYSQKAGTLDLNFRGVRKAIEPLQGMFATTILKLDELPPDPKDERIYDLGQLGKRGFDFVYEVGSGIEEVAVRKLRLSSRYNKGERITLETNTSNDSDAIYDLLDKIGKSIPLSLYNVTQVEIAASVVRNADKPPKNILFRITYPNSCSLKYDVLGMKLRDMLEASGIEPKEPEEVEETLEPAET